MNPVTSLRFTQISRISNPLRTTFPALIFEVYTILCRWIHPLKKHDELFKKIMSQ